MPRILLPYRPGETPRPISLEPKSPASIMGFFIELTTFMMATPSMEGVKFYIKEGETFIEGQCEDKLFILNGKSEVTMGLTDIHFGLTEPEALYDLLTLPGFNASKDSIEIIVKKITPKLHQPGLFIKGADGPKGQFYFQNSKLMSNVAKPQVFSQDVIFKFTNDQYKKIVEIARRFRNKEKKIRFEVKHGLVYVAYGRFDVVMTAVSFPLARANVVQNTDRMVSFYFHLKSIVKVLKLSVKYNTDIILSNQGVMTVAIKTRNASYEYHIPAHVGGL